MTKKKHPSSLEVSNFSLGMFKTCPKKWYWHYDQRIRPRRRAPQLTLGYVVHEAFDMFYKGKDSKDIMQFIDETYKREMIGVSLQDHEELIVDHKTALGMYLNFPYKQMQFQDIISEEEFTVPINRWLRFRGRVDGLVKKDGHWWVRELKTTGLPASIFERRMQVSAQATGYQIGMKQQTGKAVEGVMYDYIRKARLYKKQTEMANEYAQRIYADYSDKQKEKSYFGRYFTYRSSVDEKQWIEDTTMIAKYIRDCRKKGEFYRNTGACFTYGTECPYKRICFQEKPDKLTIELFYDREEVKKSGSNNTQGQGNQGAHKA